MWVKPEEVLLANALWYDRVVIVVCECFSKIKDDKYIFCLQIFFLLLLYRGGKSTLPDRDSNPGPLADCASTLTTELSGHTVSP